MKLLIVGLGSMGKRRAALAAGLGHSLAGVDSAAERRQQAQQLGIEPYETLSEAIAAGGYDAAFVCTAPLSHAAITLQLLKAGIPVFSELNLVADGSSEIMALAKQSGTPLFLSNTMLYRGEIEHIGKRVKEFAKPVNYIYHIGQYLPDWHPWENYKDFFVGDARTGGIREIMAIELPWLTTVFGAAVPVGVQKGSISSLELAYPDSWFVMLQHENNAKGVLAMDVVSPKAVRNFEAYGDGLHLFWEGNPAALYEYDADTKQKQQVNTYGHYQQDSRYSDNIVENAYLDEMLNFFAMLNGEAQPRWSFEKDQKVIELMEAIEAY